MSDKNILLVVIIFDILSLVSIFFDILELYVSHRKIIIDDDLVKLKKIRDFITTIYYSSSNIDLKLLNKYEYNIRPTNIKAASPEALNINGYTSEAWKNAVSFRQCFPLLEKIFNNSILPSIISRRP